MLPFQERPNPFSNDDRFCTKQHIDPTKFNIIYTKLKEGSAKEYKKQFGLCYICHHELIDEYNDELLDKQTITQPAKPTRYLCNCCKNVVCGQCKEVCSICEKATCKCCVTTKQEAIGDKIICDDCTDYN